MPTPFFAHSQVPGVHLWRGAADLWLLRDQVLLNCQAEGQLTLSWVDSFILALLFCALNTLGFPTLTRW